MITFTIQKPKEVVFEIKNVDLGADAFDRGYEAGEKDGYLNGYEIGAKEGAEVGYAKGEQEGYEKGHTAGVADGIEQGKQEEYDRFWDAYQENGNRTDYSYAFSYEGWNDTTFNPKYNIVPNKANVGYMFSYSKMSNIAETLKNRNIVIDFSQCTTAADILNNAETVEFPDIDCGNFTAMTNTFRFAKKLQKASLSNVKATYTWSNSFASCGELTDITFSGTIGRDIFLGHSSKLSTASIQSIIDALADLTGQTAQKVTFHKDVGGRLTQAQKDAISAKNWTLVY